MKFRYERNRKICQFIDKTKVWQVPTRLELVTFCVLSRRDNHYTTEPLVVKSVWFYQIVHNVICIWKAISIVCICYIPMCNYAHVLSLWRNRLARQTVNLKVGGSSPPRDVHFFAPWNYCLIALSVHSLSSFREEEKGWKRILPTWGSNPRPRD